ncbi:hypothetical protein N7494_004210 [Penicillium frequentans]|uniref:Fungal N-terminal domain-containing protein n=1 Tax=Penicillium frequentans TaxID=3151616 RepID=A0AAD6D084_9EURO|nr:hypothetical protein N7494_004210 [Penicillium glabrum]
MAEVIGVVSGALTFATVVVQLGKSIATLKDCWNQLNDAPEDIRRLVREIELLSLIVGDLEEDLSQDSVSIALTNSKYVLQCITLCKDAVKDLDSLCTDISRDTKTVKNLRWAYKSTKLVIQKGKIEKHVARLQNVIQLLMLSQQCYIRAVIHAQPKLILEKFERHRPSCSDSANSVVALTYEKRCNNHTAFGALQRKSRRFAKDPSYRWRFSLPYWMSSKVLEVTSMKAPNGWNWMLRAYSVIPFWSRAVGCVMCGNLQLLQDMFASGQASPFDQVEDTNYSLLHWVGRENRSEIIEFLLSQGVDPNSSNYIPINCRVSIKRPKPAARETPSLIPSLRVLFQHIDIQYETAQDAVEYALRAFHGTPEEFAFLQQHTCPSFYQLPKSERIKLALQVTSNWDSHNFQPELIQSIARLGTLGADGTNEDSSLECAQLKLLHHTVRAMGISQRTLQISGHDQDIQSACDSWSNLFHELLCLGMGIHSIHDEKTLFLAFIHGYFNMSTISPFQSGNAACNLAIQVWLHELKSAGIDLIRYGETEKRLWAEGTLWREIDGWNIAEQASDMQRVIGFSYGSSPEDWNMWLAEASDDFVGQFWEIIERPVEVMPGAWPDKERGNIVQAGITESFYLHSNFG